MGNQSAKEDVSAMAGTTTFSREELEALHAKFLKKYSTGYMTRQEFIDENIKLQGGTSEFWADVYQRFTGDTDTITFKDFIVGLSSMSEGTPEERLQWMFRMYDLDHNGTLDQEEVYHLIKGLLKTTGSSKTEEELRATADAFFKKMDKDGDGAIDLDEFVSVALKTAFIREALTSAMTSSLEIDSGKGELSTFDNQVAGHKGDASMLKDEGTIFKPLAQAEFEFYTQLAKHPECQKYFPNFHGRKVVESDTGSTSYIVLEDLTTGMEQAAICDLKMGFRGHDDKASRYKVVQQVALCKFTTSSSIGFRMCGMRYTNSSDAVVVRDKPWGARLTRNTMKHALVEFMAAKSDIRFDVLGVWLEKLRDLRDWFATQTLWKMYSSSILLLYDTASTTPESAEIRVVDFAHTFPTTDGTIDSNYLKGLESLLVILEDVYSGRGELWENQRKSGSHYVGSTAVTKGDFHNWSDAHGDVRRTMADPSQWVVDANRPDTDGDGWSYANKFSAKKSRWSSKPGGNVRRRRYHKVVVHE